MLNTHQKQRKRKQSKINGIGSNQNRSHNQNPDRNLLLLVQCLTNRVLNVGELSELQLVLVFQMFSIHI